MKKLYTLTISLLLILNLTKAQVPQGFKYQTAIRDNNGAVIANKLVAIKLSLLTGSANGTAVYSEVHKVAINDFGVANLNVGNGTVSLGNFSNIDWGSNTFFLKTEADINNGTNFTFMGSSQLLSVPFAMYAAKSANAADDKDKDSTNELQTITLNNNNLQLNKNGGSVDLTKYTIDNNTDSQTISLSGNTLAITRGNFVKINDIDSTNELQQITLTNNNLQLNKNGGSVDLTKYDKDSQQLALNGNILSITKGNSIILSSAVDLDADPTNEIQNLSLSKDTLKLSKANYVVLPKDNDADSTNEIQSLTYRNDTLQISKSNQIVLPKDNDKDSLNELQTIRRSNDTLYLSKGNFTVLPKVNSVPSGSIITSTTFNDTNITKLGYTFVGGFQQNFQNQPDSFYWQWGNTISSMILGREAHSAIWTGSVMIIWGGNNFLNTGVIYNPSTNSWSNISTVGAPSGRQDHSAVWTGTEMIIWGGFGFSGYLNDGAKYNPQTNSWSTIASNVNNSMYGHSAIWTGSEMLIFGGVKFPGGVRSNNILKYNPDSNTWSNITVLNSPSPRDNHSSIWTGTEMIIWGGFDGSNYLNDGSKFNKQTNSWTAISNFNAPIKRMHHSAVWNGDEMIIWGGTDSNLSSYYKIDGAKYNSTLNSWEVLPNTNALSKRIEHSAIWTGSEMIICGGFNGSNLNDGKKLGRYYSNLASTYPTTFYLYRKN